MELWGWRWMERGVLVMGDGESGCGAGGAGVQRWRGPRRGGGGAARPLLGPRLAQSRACEHTRARSREGGKSGRKMRVCVRRRCLKRAAAVKVGSGRWVGERGWGWAGFGDAPSREAKS